MPGAHDALHRLTQGLRRHGPVLLAGVEQPHDELLTLVWGPHFDPRMRWGWRQAGPHMRRTCCPLVQVADCFDALHAPAQQRLRRMIPPPRRRQYTAPAWVKIHTMHRILLIDDDEQLGPCWPPTSSVSSWNWCRRCGPARPNFAGARGFDAAILDVMLPEMDGFELCRSIGNTQQHPAHHADGSRRGDGPRGGAGTGCRRHLPKPFEPRELVARLQTVLRRMKAAVPGDAHEAQDVLSSRAAHRPARRSVQCLGRDVELTGTEFDLLHLLAREAGRVLSRDDILNDLRGHEAELYTRAVDIVVSRLRKSSNRWTPSRRCATPVTRWPCAGQLWMRRKLAGRHAGQAPWHRRARQAVHRSLRLRLVLVFVLLALAMAVTFIGGVQRRWPWAGARRPARC